MNDFDSSDICFPITDISEVLNWKCNGKCWIHKHDVLNLGERSNHLSSGSVLDTREKRDTFSEYKWSSSLLPKTIFCHDYKGGYVEDRFCNGSSNVDTYRFFNWAAIDIFIYFSHKLVTIPTQGWLNAGHTHGVPVLGTVITEWNDGEKIWGNILTDLKKINLLAEKLAEICAHFKFDGYLLNIENKISKDHVPRLIQFVALLKANLNLYCGQRTWLIWYDSVTTEGDLNWQNKLCPLNKPFFDVCDGIFLNYVWKPVDLLESIDLAASRKYDVYVGVDIYGRNCYQDGGFNVDKAMAVLRSKNMSVALFALGWTFEKLPQGEDFLQREIYFWKKFSPYLYFHGPAKLPFSTNFCQGISFDKKSGGGLFNLGMQQYQPSGQACCSDLDSKDSCISLCLNDGVLYNGACLKIAAVSCTHSKIFHRVFICDFSSANEKSSTLKITISVKMEDQSPSGRFRVYFVLEDKTSLEGKTGVSMTRRPKGYRAGVKIDKLLVTGSLIDFTAEAQTDTAKIRILKNNGQVSGGNLPEWQEVWLNNTKERKDRKPVDSQFNMTGCRRHIIFTQSVILILCGLQFFRTFFLDLKEVECLTEILLLPAYKAPVMWGLLRIEEYNKVEEISQKADDNLVVVQEKADNNLVFMEKKADSNSVFGQSSDIIIVS